MEQLQGNVAASRSSRYGKGHIHLYGCVFDTCESTNIDCYEGRASSQCACWNEKPL